MSDRSSGEGSRGSERRSVPFGGLPDSVENVPRVTTMSSSDTNTARSVGGIAAMAPPRSLEFGPSPTERLAMSSFGPSSRSGLPQMPPNPMSKSAPIPISNAAPRSKSDCSDVTTGSFESFGSPKVQTESTWNVTDASIPTLPDFHPLERTAVFVPHTSASTVATRVANILCERSISTEFHVPKAKAKCTTVDGVEFRVRLYRGKKTFSHGIIVEVQRRFGFSVTFHVDTVAILDGAEGKTSPLPTSLPSVDDLVPDVTDEEDASEEEHDEDVAFAASAGSKRKLAGATGASSLAIASDMIKKGRTADAAVLALESLASLTDPVRMGSSTALRVSQKLLSNKNGENDILEAVTSLLKDGRLPRNGTEQQEINENVEYLRRMAMTVISNAVVVIASNPSSMSALKNKESFFVRDVLPVLLKDIQRARTDPRMASLAARCLESLGMALGESIAQPAMEGGAIESLSSARDVGKASHANLASNARKCIDALESR